MRLSPAVLFLLCGGCCAAAFASPIEDTALVVSTTSIAGLIRTAAEDPSPVARENAQKVIVGMGPDSILGLEQALKEGSARIRATAVQMLGDLGDPKTAPALIQAAQTDTYRLVRSRALKALDHISNAKATTVFVAALQSDQDPNVRATAADALGRSSDPAAAAALIQALADPSDEVSNAAVEALASIKPVPTEALVKALKDKRPIVRAHAAEALGSTDDLHAVAPVMKLLHDNDPVVRRAAVEALSSLNAAEVVPPLQDLLHSEKDPAVLQSLHEALASLGH